MTVRNTQIATPSIGRVGKRRQVVIPKDICKDLGLQEGDFVEVRRAEGAVLIKPKRLVDPDDILTSREENAVRQGEAELRRGDYVTLAQLHHDLDRSAIKKRRKTA
jgi:AbrB family looped-hinge helix DNA binding protein